VVQTQWRNGDIGKENNTNFSRIESNRIPSILTQLKMTALKKAQVVGLEFLIHSVFINIFEGNYN
jgi:hypothetical protein